VLLTATVAGGTVNVSLVMAGRQEKKVARHRLSKYSVEWFDSAE
jgi:hypothetical protein